MNINGFIKREFKHGVVYLGDAQKILEKLDRSSAEICVTSPPYNLCKRYSNYTQTKTGKSMTEKYEEWYPDEEAEWTYQGEQQSIIHKLLRVCRSSIFYNHRIRYAWHGRNEYRTKSNLHHPMHWLWRFPVWEEIIWDRCGIGNPSRRYYSQNERVYQIERPKKWNNIDGLTNIWKFPPSKNIGHVCTFPEKLVENCIIPTTDVGDTVVDPYLGSGTTAIVAIKLGRKFIGIEIDPTYFASSCRNIQKVEDEREAVEGVVKFLFNIIPRKKTVEFIPKFKLEEKNDKQS